MNQQVEQVMEKAVPAQAVGNVAVAAAAKAADVDWIWWLTLVLILIQLVWWVIKCGRDWGWWGKGSSDGNQA
ncbi:MAG: hypothetical protein KF822_09520 [Steroidobacteraceae bacterium]|nr:hypothetical protein [Steroidobacteraceae bacterium]